MDAKRIEIENVNQLGKTYPVDAAKYAAMRKAFLAVVPANEPGLTPGEIKDRVLPFLPDDLFPKGATAGWWVKAVQLDLEAKGLVQRAAKAPVRLTRA